MIPNIAPDLIYDWTMTFLRAGTLLAMLPAFSGETLPAQLRIALAAFLGYMACAFAHVNAVMPQSFVTLALSAGNELLIGLFMGMTVRVVFYAAEMAGQIISGEMGLTAGATLDPSSRNMFTPTSLLLSNLGALLLLASGGHHAIFYAFLRSYAFAPVGRMGFDPSAAEVFVNQTANVFLLALQMAAPIMAVNFTVTLTFAVMGKASPGINVFNESYAARILAGLTVLSLTLALAAQYMLGYLERAPEFMLRLVR